ncbi:calcium/sodium antiporter [uncultured Microbulbifer sp.]|uniref:calcium/sodium antiporter n=1 Tax=uncultured Microbulbifer sp. TaxID=348147 RepID=UPI002629FED6|nr:calcium/sodium antiporter [uncultured Microbulbifer sp.]
MLLAALAIIAGFIVLVWSADRFVEGAAATAKHAGMPTLLIGMVIVGFGTSAPEMVVSAIAALDGSPGLALGNAYGSNIANTGLILGLSALLIPLTVHSKIVRKELPLLLAITLLSGAFLWNDKLERWEGIILLLGFFALIGWSIFSALRGKGDQLEGEVAGELEEHSMPLGRAIFWVVAGLILLIISSRMLVWGAVSIAESLGVSDLIIGLTIVALGTSLPELAATIVAARKGEHDIAIGNVVGSNMFNLLAVVGIAGTIAPMSSVPPEVLSRDWPMVIGLTIALFIFAYGFRGQGRINRWEGAALLTAYLVYTGYLISTITKAAL